ILPLQRLESRRQRKPLRKIDFHSLFFHHGLALACLDSLVYFFQRILTAWLSARSATSWKSAALHSFTVSYRDSIRQIDPNHLVLRPRKMRSGKRFSYLALDLEETRAI